MIIINIYTVSLFGHRYIEHHSKTEDKLDKILSDLICEKEYVDFLIGKDGEFDILAASAIKKAVNYIVLNLTDILELK